MDRLEAQLTFARELDRLKGVLRQSRLFDDSRAENSAEHSWHIAILATLLAEYGPPGIDLARVVRLCLVHDIVEIDAGDVFIYAEADRAAVAVAEVAAAQRLFGLLPPEQAAEWRACWEEFEAGETDEARFARAMDRLMPMLHNLYGNGSSWQRHGVTYAQVEARNRPILEIAPRLWAHLEPLLAKAVADGRLRGPGPAA